MRESSSNNSNDNCSCGLSSSFLLHEYDALQDRIARSVTDISKIETIIPLAIAAIYAWLWKDGIDAGAAAKWFHLIPPMLTVFGILRQEVRNSYIKKVEQYLRRVERRVYGQTDLHNSVCGWENYYASVLSTAHRLLRRTFWGMLLASTTALAVYHLFR